MLKSFTFYRASNCKLASKAIETVNVGHYMCAIVAVSVVVFRSMLIIDLYAVFNGYMLQKSYLCAHLGLLSHNFGTVSQTFEWFSAI